MRNRPLTGAVLIALAGALLAVFVPARSVQWVGYAVVLTVSLSYIYSAVIRRGLVATRDSGDLVIYRYRNATVSLTLSNRSVLPVPYLVVVDNPGTLYSGEDNARVMSLRGREDRTFSYRIRGMNRGSYRIGPVNLRFGDPLGLFPVSVTIPKEVRLIVYPSILPVSVEMDAGLPSGTVTTPIRIYEDPTRYRSVREYVPGDELRRVNWMTTARTGRLHSTEYLPTISFPVMCVLNLTAGDYERRHRYQHVERTIDAAASLIYALADRGQAVGLASTGVLPADDRTVSPWIPVSSDPGRAANLLETLAQIQASEKETPDIVSFFLGHGSVPFGTRVFYLGPPLEPDRVVKLASGLGQRSLLRLHYTEENVADWRSLAVDAVELWRITEFGDELFVRQT